MGVSSEQSGDNMNRFVVALAFVGCAFGAPSILPAVGHAYTAGSAVVGHGPAVATSGAYAAGPAVAHGAPVASAPAVVGQTHHTYAAGAPVVENRLSTELSDTRLCRLERSLLLVATSTLLPELNTFPSPLYPASLDLPWTPLRPVPCPLP